MYQIYVSPYSTIFLNKTTLQRVILASATRRYKSKKLIINLD